MTTADISVSFVPDEPARFPRGRRLVMVLVAMVAAVAAAVTIGAVVGGERADRAVVTSAAPAVDADAAVDEAIAREFPVIEGAELPAGAATPAVVERQIPPGAYRYEVRGTTPELSDVNDGVTRIVEPTVLAAPSVYDVAINQDGSFRADQVAGPGAADERWSHRFDGTVHEDWVGDTLLFRAAENVAGPAHEFSRVAAGAVLTLITGEREAAARAGGEARVEVESVECPAGTCVHVASWAAVSERQMTERLESIPRRDGPDIERDDVVYDPVSGLVYFHQLRTNDVLVDEFRLTDYPWR